MFKGMKAVIFICDIMSTESNVDENVQCIDTLLYFA